MKFAIFFSLTVHAALLFFWQNPANFQLAGHSQNQQQVEISLTAPPPETVTIDTPVEEGSKVTEIPQKKIEPKIRDKRKSANKNEDEEKIKQTQLKRNTVKKSKTVKTPQPIKTIKTVKAVKSVKAIKPPSKKITIKERQAKTPSSDTAAIAKIRRQIQLNIGEHFIYPRVAQRNGWQGRVDLKFKVNLNGKISAITIIKSSGYKVLDKAATTTLSRIEKLSKTAPNNSTYSIDMQLPIIYQLN
ncbi:MAG: energy transducer TonB [Thiotrichales bacterium]|nr:energy transducer TonB [Thiotrichales bacterium]MBT7314402.1 energy transducer TonB [Thiotrichales bacterium]MBT7870564.1 energy transducer TonB [Thiotrichales bacterium]